MDMVELSIQEMVERSAVLDDIPTCYLVDQEAAISSEENPFPASPEIPILDMKSLLAEDNKTSQLDKFHSTCKEWGIFQVVNHGVDSSLVEKLKYEIMEFYKLPLEERLKFKIRPGDVEGYGQTLLLSTDQKVDWADRFFIITNPIHGRKPHLFPLLPSSLRETLEAYISELQKVSMAILGLIAETLKIDVSMLEDGMQSMRMNYYPPCRKADKVMGLRPHSDAAGISILLQVNGVQGFQIKKHGVWMPVNLLPQAFLVNLGDVIEILSNGVYKSIEHRARVNSEKERITLAMFFNPKFEAEVGPSPLLLIEEEPHFRHMKMEQYVKHFFSKSLNGKYFLDFMKV